jgi:hypothetical protein
VGAALKLARLSVLLDPLAGIGSDIRGTAETTLVLPAS